MFQICIQHKATTFYSPVVLFVFFPLKCCFLTIFFLLAEKPWGSCLHPFTQQANISGWSPTVGACFYRLSTCTYSYYVHFCLSFLSINVHPFCTPVLTTPHLPPSNCLPGVPPHLSSTPPPPLPPPPHSTADQWQLRDTVQRLASLCLSASASISHNLLSGPRVGKTWLMGTSPQPSS